MIAKEEKLILVTENELEISLNEAFKLFSHKVRTLFISFNLFLFIFAIFFNNKVFIYF